MGPTVAGHGVRGVMLWLVCLRCAELWGCRGEMLPGPELCHRCASGCQRALHTHTTVLVCPGPLLGHGKEQLSGV